MDWTDWGAQGRRTDIESYSPALDDLVSASAVVRELATGNEIGGGPSAGWGRGCDGPFWIAEEGCLAFSDAGNHRRLAWSPDEGVTEFTGDTRRALGATRDQVGRVVSCEWATGMVTRQEPGGGVTLIASTFEGRRLNRPDDVVVAPDGSIIFTDVRDPFTDVREPFAVPQGACVPTSAVYRVTRDGMSIQMVTDQLEEPSGLVLAPDGTTLYVSDGRSREIMSYPVESTGEIDGQAGTLFARIEGPGHGAPFGLTVDVHGNIYSGGPGGIWILDSSGDHLGIITHPATKTTNLAWGGESWSTLFFTTPVALGSVGMRTHGCSVPAGSPKVPISRKRLSLTVDRRVDRHHPDLDRIIAPGTEILPLASGGLFDDLGGGPSHRYARTLEGPVWVEDGGYLFFSDIGNNRQIKWTADGNLSVLHHPTNHTNGAALDQQGRIVSCEHSSRRVTRREKDGSITVIADQFEGRRLSRPNDVVVRSDGNIYFTAPWWDFGSGEAQEVEFNGVFRVSPDLTTVTAVVRDFELPNGLCFSPDEQTLYINDTRRREIRAFNMLSDGSLDPRSNRVFAQLYGEGYGSPDGMKVDIEGNVYCGGPGGVWILDPDGTHLGTIVHGAAQTNNLVFGGPNRRTLFFVSWVSFSSIDVRIPGAPIPRSPIELRLEQDGTP